VAEPRAVRLLPAVWTGRRTIALIALLSLSSAGAALAESSPGQGSYVQGHDSAGGSFGVAFNLADHQAYGAVDTFNCSGKRSKSFKYGFDTSAIAPVHHANGVIGTFQGTGRHFDYSFQDAYWLNSGNNRRAGTATITIAGEVTQVGAFRDGHAKSKGSGTVSITASRTCRTGTLKWSGTGVVYAG